MALVLASAAGALDRMAQRRPGEENFHGARTLLVPLISTLQLSPDLCSLVLATKAGCTGVLQAYESVLVSGAAQEQPARLRAAPLTSRCVLAGRAGGCRAEHEPRGSGVPSHAAAWEASHAGPSFQGSRSARHPLPAGALGGGAGVSDGAGLHHGANQAGLCGVALKGCG